MNVLLQDRQVLWGEYKSEKKSKNSEEPWIFGWCPGCWESLSQRLWSIEGTCLCWGLLWLYDACGLADKEKG